jgi:hypothetical protein
MTPSSDAAVSAGAMLDISVSLVDIRPPVPVSGRDHAAWMAATLDGRFYLAWLGFDRERLRDSQCILRYSPDTGTWETVYQKTSSRRGARNEEVASLPSAFLTNYPSGKNGTLYARFASPLGGTRLCSVEDGANFRSVRIDSQDFTAALALREVVAGSAAHYALFAEKGRNALKSRSFQIRSGRWEELSVPIRSRGPVPPEPSHIAFYDGRLVLAIDDPREGFDLWTMAANGKKSPDWNSLLTRGGQYYSMNAQVFACVPWKNALYVACGRSEPRHGRQYQEGFEILRIYSDGSWDIAIGAPRVTPSGLKIPLACLGPGMDEFEPARFCLLSAAADELILGTYDDVGGFRIWCSRDGESWSDSADAELAGLPKVRLASGFPISEGTVLLLEFESPLKDRTFNIWFRPCRNDLRVNGLAMPSRQVPPDRPTPCPESL